MCMCSLLIVCAAWIVLSWPIRTIITALNLVSITVPITASGSTRILWLTVRSTTGLSGEMLHKHEVRVSLIHHTASVRGKASPTHVRDTTGLFYSVCLFVCFFVCFLSLSSLNLWSLCLVFWNPLKCCCFVCLILGWTSPGPSGRRARNASVCDVTICLTCFPGLINEHNKKKKGLCEQFLLVWMWIYTHTCTQ